jgi:hypothetical protein
MTAFVLPVRGPFSLAASARFLEGFGPAAFDGAAGRPLELAFPVEGIWQTVGVRVREHADGVEAEVVSPAATGAELLEAVRDQVARILSLDVDGAGFPAVGERDPVVGGLQRAAELGQAVSFGGRALSAFPAPQRLVSLDATPPGCAPCPRPTPSRSTLLLRTYLEDETGEIAGRRAPGGRAPGGRA